MKKLSLLEGIEDIRRERSVWYPLHEVLFIFLAAVICGATSYVKVEMFGKSLEQLELKGCIVTIDAMGTQSEIAAAITSKGAGYILSLKENQPGLYRDVKLYFEEYRRNTAGLPAACCARSHSQ